MSEQLKYPYFPPYDNEIKFYEGSRARVNPKGVEKMAKTCPKCQFPIHVRVYMKPCLHYLCYECYTNNRYECAYCNRIIVEAIRVGDRDKMYSCDGKCFIVFETEEEFKQHQVQHQLLQSEQKNMLKQQKNQ